MTNPKRKQEESCTLESILDPLMDLLKDESTLMTYQEITYQKYPAYCFVAKPEGYVCPYAALFYLTDLDEEPYGLIVGRLDDFDPKTLHPESGNGSHFTRGVFKTPEGCARCIIKHLVTGKQP